MYARALRRLKRNPQLFIITMMGVFGVLGITPYIIYRAYHANFLVAIADLFAVISIIIAVIYAWRTNDTAKPGLYLSVIFSVVATLVTINLGINGFFWIYPLILFNFFIIPPSRALVTMLVVLASLVIYNLYKPESIFSSHYQMVSFLVTCLLASFLSFIFAYRTQHQHARLEQLAAHDHLTGAYNRRVMTEELRKAARERRSGRNYGLLILDIDHFKRINDAFGHSVGDQVLMDFTTITKSVIRESDILFRHGGEEFALLLPDTDLKGLHTVASTIQKTIFSKLTSPAGPVSVSIGGAILSESDQWEDWINRADEQLYAAKAMGRNCYKIAV